MDDVQGVPPDEKRDAPNASDVVVPVPQVQSGPEPGAQPQAARPEPTADRSVPDWVGMPSADEPKDKKEKEGHGSFLKELPILIIIAFGLALLIKTFLLQAFYIPSESMLPTLRIGDRVLVNKLVYRIHPPRRGDILVFIENPGPHRSFWGRVRSFLTEGLGVTKPPSRDFIKRVIGLPGDTIQVGPDGVFITPASGKQFKLYEPYIVRSSTDPNVACGASPSCEEGPPQAPFKVPADSYFVMGDNRGNSSDSRSALGPINKTRIIGRAFVKIWPLGRFGFFHRPTYSTANAAGVMSIAPALVLGSAFVVRRRRRAA
jgi:signal peptidase I